MWPRLRADVGRQPAGAETDSAAATPAYAAHAFDPWVAHATIAAHFFRPAAGRQGEPLRLYHLAFYDIPWLHDNTREGAALLRALCAPDFRELAALDTRAVAMIVA